MKTILIPTDFNLSSLQCISDLCDSESQDISLVFLHFFGLSDSIGDLLMLSRRSREYDYVSDGFYVRCEQLKQQFPQLSSISIEFFYGSTMSTFKDFLEQKKICSILHPDLCHYSKLNKNSIDPAGMVIRCGVPLIRVINQPEKTAPEASFVSEEELLEEQLV